MDSTERSHYRRTHQNRHYDPGHHDPHHDHHNHRHHDHHDDHDRLHYHHHHSHHPYHLNHHKHGHHSHLLEIVDEDHVKGLVPAAVEEEVEAVHLQQMTVWTLIPSPCGAFQLIFVNIVQNVGCEHMTGSEM